MEKQATEDTGVDTFTTALKYVTDTTNGVKKLSNDQIETWQWLAVSDKKAFNEGFAGLDDDAKKLVRKVTDNIISETYRAIPGVDLVTNKVRKIISDNIMGTYNIKFNLISNFSELRKKLKSMLDTLRRMGNVPGVGASFANYANNIERLLNMFAGGGFPNVGELFIAREAGPELVGSIGNRNAVVNNQQIVEAVSSGVANAVASVLGNGGSSYQLIIDGEQITDVVQKRLQRRANITGMAMGV